MTKSTFLFFIILFNVTAYSQNYQISFAGKGSSSKVDSVRVENLTQCKSLLIKGSDILHLVFNAAIDELNTNTDNSLHIYPNPTTGLCYLNFLAANQGNATLSLSDIAGKRISQLQQFVTKGQNTFSLTTPGSGIYIFKVESNTYSYTARIVLDMGYRVSGNAEIKYIESAPIKDKQNSISFEETWKSLKTGKSLTQMKYLTGDRLKLTGISGTYRNVFMLVPTLSQTVTFDFVACKDIDNNSYATVKISTQIWMAENLKTTTYNDGIPIQNVTETNQWENLKTPAYCWYDNNAAANKKIYGALYNWYAVNTGKLCPSGWHVPDYIEWADLINSIGGETEAGGNMKEPCSSLWGGYNEGATNSSGFSGLPGGLRSSSYDFLNIEDQGKWWDAGSTEISPNSYGLYYNSGEITVINLAFYYLASGFSVRCMKN